MSKQAQGRCRMGLHQDSLAPSSVLPAQLSPCPAPTASDMLTHWVSQLPTHVPPAGGVSPAVRGQSRALCQPLAHVLRHRMSEDAAALRGTGLTWPRGEQVAQPPLTSEQALSLSSRLFARALDVPELQGRRCRQLVARTGQSRCLWRLGRGTRAGLFSLDSSQLTRSPRCLPASREHPGA